MVFRYRWCNGWSFRRKRKLDNIEKTKCHRMTGNVSTENNGGFIQIRTY